MSWAEIRFLRLVGAKSRQFNKESRQHSRKSCRLRGNRYDWAQESCGFTGLCVGCGCRAACMALDCYMACFVPRGTFISLYVGVYPFHKKPGKTRLSPPRRPFPERNDRLQSTQSRSKIRQVKRKISSVFPPFFTICKYPYRADTKFCHNGNGKTNHFVIIISIFLSFC